MQYPCPFFTQANTHICICSFHIIPPAHPRVDRCYGPLAGDNTETEMLVGLMKFDFSVSWKSLACFRRTQLHFDSAKHHNIIILCLLLLLL